MNKISDMNPSGGYQKPGTASNVAQAKAARKCTVPGTYKK